MTPRRSLPLVRMCAHAGKPTRSAYDGGVPRLAPCSRGFDAPHPTGHARRPRAIRAAHSSRPKEKTGVFKIPVSAADGPKSTRNGPGNMRMAQSP
ncbi:hypothetical protein SAV14893_067060 [Streptomyces avermitilis]|uniref:Uncharacterized protein n=1 Tax=Streptomyces avermitilis TaxID=33903 RepID=A0A4D4MKT7_STRAX|nr:hypothetical protein SAVMC3_79780 [Streptomyces avermitilis]GDY67313.1 hypothetical protein SAV14893_067060 [Streptomyces avermitilis]GDY72396.1 hypothetical protein SAV31267_018810 [Streptomyces avermitilis]GDY81538.1 hypothetical protein SAVCW2_07370 [Streptomyces avermitilis]